MQTTVDACGCHASKQSDIRYRGLMSSLPIPYCTNSLLYVDFIHGLPRFAGYESCLVVNCSLSPMRPTAGGIFLERNLRTKTLSSNEEAF